MNNQASSTIDPNMNFTNMGVIIGLHSDALDMLKILIKNNIPVCFTENGRLMINDHNDIASVKKMPITIENGFSTIRLNWIESSQNEVSKILKDLGYKFHFMGDDGSWLAVPYYLATSKKSHAHIKSLAQQGYFSKVRSMLWDLT